MDFKKISEVAKEKGIKVGLMNKGLFKFAAVKIEDEEIVEIAEGMNVGGIGKFILIVTRKFVYVFKKNENLVQIDTDMIPINKITSVSIKSGIMTINDGTNERVISSIMKTSGDLQKTILSLQE